MPRFLSDLPRLTFVVCLVGTSGCGGDVANRLLAPDGGTATPVPDSATPALQEAGIAVPKTKLVVFSDPHYFDPSLGTTGAAFDAYVAHESKLIAESDAIMRAMVAMVEVEGPQAVLVSGDLTKDGERSSHARVAAYLRQMGSGGRKVFVVPGNHDIENAAAASYDGDLSTGVPTISAGEFAEIYGEMGYASAISRDPASLSYLAEIVPGLWLLALDSCIRGDAPGTAITGGQLSASTKTWIQAQLALAQTRGQRVLAMMHHGVVEHFTGQASVFPDYLVAERDQVAALLAEGGVGVVFTGHFHANDITRAASSGSVNPIFDVETGSMVTYPCSYHVAEVSADTLTIAARQILAIDYDLGGAPNLQAYARDHLRSGLGPLLENLLQEPPYSISADQARQLAPWLVDGLVAHYAGDEAMPADVPSKAQALIMSGNSTQMLAGLMLTSVWTDLPPADSAAVLDLGAR